MINRLHLIFGISIILGTCAGCGTLLRTSDSCQFHSYKECDLAIKYYEEKGCLPPSNTFTIAEAYAFRSVCLAQEVPWYGRTRMSIKGVYDETKNCDTLALAWFLWTPVSLVVDTVEVPFAAYSTATLSDDCIQAALRDLQQARRLGYKKVGWYHEAMFVPARTHLDHLGFILKPNPTKSEPTAAASPSEGRSKVEGR